MNLINPEFSNMRSNKVIHFINRMDQRFGVRLSGREYDELNKIFSDKIPSSLFKVKIKNKNIDYNKDKEKCISYVLDLIITGITKRLKCVIVYNTVYKAIVTIVGLD